jgi:hypothetical protein
MESIEQTGTGTLSDAEDVELTAVDYRIKTADTVGGVESDWGGELTFADAPMVIEPGRYVLTLNDGTQVAVDLEPLGSADGGAGRVEFRGVGVFGKPVN